MDLGVCSNSPVHVISVSKQTGLSVTLETMKRKAYSIQGKKWQVSLWESLCQWHPPTTISLLLIFLSFKFQGHLKNWVRRESCRLCLSVGNYINPEVCTSLVWFSVPGIKIFLMEIQENAILLHILYSGFPICTFWPGLRTEKVLRW